MTEQTPPDSWFLPAEIAIARLAALYGGHEAVWKNVEGRRAAFNTVWQQDSEELGQVLHAHLVVEFFLTEFLQRLHPALDLDQLRLRYEQKVGMIPSTHALLSGAKPGLRALGTIRNRMAHVRRVQISKDDIQAIVGIAMYSAFTKAGGTFDLTQASPKEVVIHFSEWAAGMFHSAADPDKQKWATAFDASQDVPGYEFFLKPPPSDGVPGVGRKTSLLGDS
ncbi:hypothetical protein [Variovorax paradoxus]|nr:hypothetical protein [Variovorax paradoxus]